MPYQINGTDLTLQPEMGAWVNRQGYGKDGSGHEVYPRNRQFELRWGFISIADFQQLRNFYEAVTTGTVVVSLPQFGAASYSFYSYSGCVLREPEVGAYFEEYLSDVRLIVTNIPT